jgi:hypothetical protein
MRRILAYACSVLIVLACASLNFAHAAGKGGPGTGGASEGGPKRCTNWFRMCQETCGNWYHKGDNPGEAATCQTGCLNEYTMCTRT